MGMIGVIAEMQLGTILVIYVINNLFTGSLYTHIKGAHEGLKYYYEGQQCAVSAELEYPWKSQKL